MTAAPPSLEALEAAVNFLWPLYTDKEVSRAQFAAGSIQCQRLARALDAFAAEAVERELEKQRERHNAAARRPGRWASPWVSYINSLMLRGKLAP